MLAAVARVRSTVKSPFLYGTRVCECVVCFRRFEGTICSLQTSGTDYAVTWRYFPVTGTVSFEVTVSTKCLLRAAYHHKHTAARYNKPINSSVGKVPRLGTERYRVRVLAGTISCFLLQTVQIGSGAHRTPYLTGTGVFFPLVVDRGVKPTTQIHLMSRLRMNGAVTLFPLYAFTHSIGTTLGL